MIQKAGLPLLIGLAAFPIMSGISTAAAFELPQKLVVAQAPEKPLGEAEGVIKGVDESERKLLISHGPISGALEMPSMTLAFRLAPDIELSGQAPGATVKFTVSRDAKCLYVIEKIRRGK